MMFTLKKSLVIFSFLAMLVLGQEPETMSWQEQRKLTWQDFKDEPLQGTSAVALTASGITFGYSIKTSNDRVVGFKTTIEAHFYPQKSWYIKERCNAHILGHEQLHFDITELHVRKLREATTRLKPSQSIARQLDKLHQEINQQLSKMQTRYDEESNHSINKESQKQWEDFVNLELKKLSRFASK